MIFHEIHSAYYRAVAEILAVSMEASLSPAQMRQIVSRCAFSESALNILPALKNGRWPLLDSDGRSLLRHKPTIPLTTLEKRWLKALADDPRIRLFEPEFPELADVKPLFSRADYRIYDQYADGDPFDHPDYIRNFRLIRSAILEKRPVKILMTNRQGRNIWIRFYPVGLEYSLKDDKIRVLASGCRFRQFNLARVIECRFCDEAPPFVLPPADPLKELTLLITNQRNALERSMLHFAHFKKQLRKMDDGTCQLRLYYNESDETELVIRVLSFGPNIRVLAPDDFVSLIRDRLLAQKDCALL